MNELLQSIRADLLSRRMLPLLAAVALALALAVGYALTGSGTSGSQRRAAAGAGNGTATGTLAVAAAAPNPNAAEAETPGGAKYQTEAQLRNPFTPLPEAKSSSVGKSGSASGEAKSSGGSGGSGSGSSGGSSKAKGGESSPAPTPPKPTKPNPAPSKPKPSFPYDVSILFGQLPPSGQPVTLPPFQALRPQQPIPSASNARIALERVSADAKSAVFALLSPPILRGQGACLPSASECQQLALAVGRSEELEYVEASGQAVVYELKTVSIVKSSSQAAG